MPPVRRMPVQTARKRKRSELCELLLLCLGRTGKFAEHCRPNFKKFGILLKHLPVTRSFTCRNKSIVNQKLSASVFNNSYITNDFPNLKNVPHFGINSCSSDFRSRKAPIKLRFLTCDANHHQGLGKVSIRCKFRVPLLVIIKIVKRKCGN